MHGREQRGVLALSSDLEVPALAFSKPRNLGQITDLPTLHFLISEMRRMGLMDADLEGKYGMVQCLKQCLVPSNDVDSGNERVIIAVIADLLP